MNNIKHAKVALVSGFWGQNIGNAFFNIGGKWILEEIFGKSNVAFIQDQPAYRTFYNQKKGLPKNDFGLLSKIDSEYLVLQGPMLTLTFESIWGKTFETLHKRGVKVLLIGAAYFTYTEEEFKKVKDFLSKYPPYLISTRDQKTYHELKTYYDNDKLHNGVDSAFFVPNAFTPLTFSEKKYITMNFDRRPEPTIEIDSSSNKNEFTFNELGMNWSLNRPSLQMAFSNGGKSLAYIGALLDFRRLPKNIGEYTVVRPDHRYTPHMTWKIYQQPNAIVSDEPFTYFNLYANTSLTLSDRVHACVMSLAYGNKAMLFSKSPRSAIFERVGAENIKKYPLTINLETLNKMKEDEINFLKKHLN